jgi:hypothetical protein
MLTNMADFDEVVAASQEIVGLPWILVHMIEERPVMLVTLT